MANYMLALDRGANRSRAILSGLTGDAEFGFIQLLHYSEGKS
jgi:hypothetical protein